MGGETCVWMELKGRVWSSLDEAKDLGCNVAVGDEDSDSKVDNNFGMQHHSGNAQRLTTLRRILQ